MTRSEKLTTIGLGLAWLIASNWEGIKWILTGF